MKKIAQLISTYEGQTSETNFKNIEEILNILCEIDAAMQISGSKPVAVGEFIKNFQNKIKRLEQRFRREKFTDERPTFEECMTLFRPIKKVRSKK